MGFTSEDMKEFMTQLFPNREEVPDGVVALATPHSASGVYGSTPAGPSTSVGTAAGKFRPSSRRPLTMGTGSNSTTPLLPAATARKEDSASNSMAGAPKRSRAGMLVAIGLLVAAGGGAAFAVVHWNDGGHPGKARPSAEGGESGETETDEAPIKPKPAAKKVVEEPREEPTVGGKVQLASAPSGAQVLDGPRVLGTTPMTIKLTDDRPSLTVHLAKSGYDELAYTVSMADAPGVTLKLNAAKRHVESGPSRPKKSNEKASSPSETPLKVKSFDDVDPSGPKVKAIDE
jgi:hypothetical protein